MNDFRRRFSEAWASSRAFRIVLIVALVYFVARLAVHGYYLSMMLGPAVESPAGPSDWGLRDTQSGVPVDLQIYLDAAQRFQLREPLYERSNRIEIYQYPPLFALLFVPFLRLSSAANVTILSLLHVGAYAALYAVWVGLFRDITLRTAEEMMIWTLPVWLVFSSFWSDLGYLNIYIIMALLGSLLVTAIVRKSVVPAALWLALILQIKPHWAFAVVLPALLGRHRFFLTMLGLAALATLAWVGASVVLVEPNYVLGEYARYIQFLPHLVEDYPWRTPDHPFLGYNHSIKQIVFYFFGISTWSRRFVAGLKGLLLGPLGAVVWSITRKWRRELQWSVPTVGLDLAFALYFAVFIVLDMVWEVSLTIVIFPYLLAVSKARTIRTLLWVMFLPYALIDLWQLLSYAIFGADIVAPGLYIRTDPSIYVPWVLIVAISFYAVLLARLWPGTASQMEKHAC